MSLASLLGLVEGIPRRKRTAHLPIAALTPPPQVTLARAGLDALVAVGDAVVAGQLVLRSPATARWQRRRHAPLTGRVVGLDAEQLELAGEPAPAVATGHQGRDLSPEAIVDAAREAGLVGLGGGMFPTYAKLVSAQPIDTVIVNGCESEPYFTCDHRVLTEHRDEVECGLALAVRALGAKRGLIVDREDYYPAGYERFLVRDTVGREVPGRGLPRDVGVMVFNVQSARALHHAVCHDQPLIERVLTVAGDAVARPGNYRVLLGTAIAHVLAAAGFDPSGATTVSVGGPMMGHAAAAGEVVTAGTGGILALSAAEQAARAPQPCLRCARCYDACPVGLPVVLLLEQPGPDVLACIECGVCQYVCPSSLPLAQDMREAKARELEWD